MRFWDGLNLALRNIWNNKLRSALTVGIVLVISALIMVMYVFTVSFIDNVKAMQREIFAESGTDYTFSALYEPNLTGLVSTIPQSELDIVFSAIKDNPGIISELWSGSYDGLYHGDGGGSEGFYGNNSMALTSFNVPMPAAEGAVLSGRTWTVEDAGQNVVFISEYYSEQNFLRTGDFLLPGDSLPITCNNKTVECVVGGIIDTEKLSVKSYYQSSADIYIDSEFVSRELGARINHMSMFFLPSSSDFDFDKTYSRIVKLYNAINDNPNIKQPKSVFPAIDRLIGNVRFQVSIKTQMDQINMISALIQGVLGVLGAFILVLSVGSVANTIIMSTDKSKKFIGLMKAMGLKPRALNRIINLEAVILISAGVLLALALLYALSPVINAAMGIVLVRLMIPVPEGFLSRLTVTYPLYVPPLTAAAFILMALFSARGSMRRLNNMDVISIMNEVA